MDSNLKQICKELLIDHDATFFSNADTKKSLHRRRRLLELLPQITDKYFEFNIPYGTSILVSKATDLREKNYEIDWSILYQYYNKNSPSGFINVYESTLKNELSSSSNSAFGLIVDGEVELVSKKIVNSKRNSESDSGEDFFFVNRYAKGEFLWVGFLLYSTLDTNKGDAYNSMYLEHFSGNVSHQILFPFSLKSNKIPDLSGGDFKGLNKIEPKKFLQKKLEFVRKFQEKKEIKLLLFSNSEIEKIKNHMEFMSILKDFSLIKKSLINENIIDMIELENKFYNVKTRFKCDTQYLAYLLSYLQSVFAGEFPVLKPVSKQDPLYTMIENFRNDASFSTKTFISGNKIYFDGQKSFDPVVLKWDKLKIGEWGLLNIEQLPTSLKFKDVEFRLLVDDFRSIIKLQELITLLRIDFSKIRFFKGSLKNKGNQKHQGQQLDERELTYESISVLFELIREYYQNPTLDINVRDQQFDQIIYVKREF